MNSFMFGKAQRFHRYINILLYRTCQSTNRRASIPLEIWASRVKDNLFVVQSISTSEGGLEWEELADYMVGNLLVVAGIVLFSFIGMVVFAILGIKTKVPRRRLVRHMGGNPA